MANDPLFVGFDPIGTVYGLWTINIDPIYGFLDPGEKINWQLSGTPAPVPLPAAGWMLIAGLGGLTALRRRTKPA